MLWFGHVQITPKVKQAPNSIMYLYAATCGALVDIHFKNNFVGTCLSFLCRNLCIIKMAPVSSICPYFSFLVKLSITILKFAFRLSSSTPVRPQSAIFRFFSILGRTAAEDLAAYYCHLQLWLRDARSSSSRSRASALARASPLRSRSALGMRLAGTLAHCMRSCSSQLPFVLGFLWACGIGTCHLGVHVDTACCIARRQLDFSACPFDSALHGYDDKSICLYSQLRPVFLPPPTALCYSLPSSIIPNIWYVAGQSGLLSVCLGALQETMGKHNVTVLDIGQAGES